MKPVIKSKLIKWGLGAGCTLSAALLLSQVRSDGAFAAAHLQALAAGSEGKPTASASQDQVQQEYNQFQQKGRN
ncbi:hypothetical protein LJK87_32450 [Paenibacillus sp. P25]|nr:hypothetical protein LJK87_32450 [Paenibacillus sp. P25]